MAGKLKKAVILGILTVSVFGVLYSLWTKIEFYIPVEQVVESPETLRIQQLKTPIVDEPAKSTSVSSNESNPPNITAQPISAYSYVQKHANDGGNCEDQYGMGLINSWRESGTTYCSPGASKGNMSQSHSNKLPPAEITCYKKQVDVAENLCDAKFIYINMSLISVKPQTYEAESPVGSISGNCKKDSSKWIRENFGNAGALWLYNSFQPVQENIQCDAWIDHDVYFLSRYGQENVFHFHEDIMQAMSAYAITDLNVRDTEVIVADSGEPWGPFNIFWEKVFGKVYETGDNIRQPRTIREVIEKYAKGVKTEQSFGHGNLCFRRAVFNVHGGLSPLSRYIGQESSCKISALFRATADLVLDRFQLTPNLYETIQRVPHAQNIHSINITLISRKDYGGKSISRTIPNENALESSLRNTLCSASTKCKIEIKLLDLVPLSIIDQVKVIRDTDILIGAHGAALTYGMYSRFRGTPPVMIELQHPERFGNYHFHNMANYMGLKYYVEPVYGSLTDENIKRVVSIVVEESDRILKDGWFT